MSGHRSSDPGCSEKVAAGGDAPPRPGRAGSWRLGVVAILAVGGFVWFGVFGSQDPVPRVGAPPVRSSTTTPLSGVEAPLSFAWDLAERAGIRCDEDDGLDPTLEVCEYRGDWVSVRVFPAGDRDAVLDWAVSMVEQFDSEVLVGDGWGIEYLFSPSSDGRLEAIKAALGEGEIVPSQRAVADEVPEVVMGGPLLNWQRVMDLEEDQGFATILAAESGLWVIAGDDQVPSVLWHSADGLVWTELDTAALLGDGAVVSMLVDGGPGMVAVGFRPAGGTREAVAWMSTDGRDWTASPLGYTIPEPEQPYEEAGLDFSQVAAGSSGAVIAAWVWEGIDPPYDELELIVQSALPEDLREYEINIEPWYVRVSVGPFRVFSETVENLDVDHDLFDLYEQSFGQPSNTILFVTDDYVTWRQVDEWPGGDHPVAAMTATANGFLASTWFWEGDGVPLVSADGITWEDTELPTGLGRISWLGNHDGRLLMVGGLGWDDVLWESHDGGTTWTVWAALPAEAWEVKVGGLGLVARGEHWFFNEHVEEESTVVESGGYTMTVGQEGLSITDTDGNTVLTAYLSEAGGGLVLPEFIVADHERQMFTVVDPDGGETLMTVTYREMEDAFEAAQDRTDVGPAAFVAYSADGRVWSEQAILEVTGVMGWASLLAVGDDYAAMVIDEFDDGTSLWRGTAP